MNIEFLTFTLCIVVVFGGCIAAIAKFTLTGKAKADLTQRMNIHRFEKEIGPYKKEKTNIEIELPKVQVVNKKEVSA